VDPYIHQLCMYQPGCSFSCNLTDPLEFNGLYI